MSAENSKKERLDELLSKLVDADLSPDEHGELMALVLENDQNIGQFVDHVVLDTLLEEEIGPESLVELVDLLEAAPISATSPVPTNPDRSSKRAHRERRFLVGLAIAATVAFVAFAIFRGNKSAYADASTLVTAAISIHGQPVERVYAVELSKTDQSRPEVGRVTTQGDRFWVEMNPGKKRSWVWGRTADDSLWMTFEPQEAFITASDEVAEPLRHLTDPFSLRLQSLLREILANCELESSRPDELTHMIVAHSNRGEPHWLKSAVLEVDVETKAIRRLSMKRQFGKRLTTLTFTLVDARPSDEELFHPEGHLSGDFQIIDRHSNPNRWTRVLRSRFGPGPANWIKEGKE